MDVTMNQRNLLHGHKAAPLKYLKTAMERFNLNNTLFFICSNDMSWARWKLTGLFPNVHFVNSGFREVDLCVLSMCHKVVMTTGTFSWWAAYLANATETVYYGRWPRLGSEMDKMMRKDDYFMPEWTAVDAW